MKRLKRLLWIPLLFLCATNCLAEDLYVGQLSAGDDSGSSCANQKAALWFNTAGSWGDGGGKISAGDTVHLCGTISTALIVQASGTEGNKITFLWEDGAKLSKDSWNGIAFNGNGKEYLVWDGGTNGIIENTDNGTAGTYTYSQNAQGIWAESCNYCEIKNLHIHNIYVRTELTDSTPSWSMVSCGYLGGTNFSIHDNVCHDASGGFLFNAQDGQTNIRFYNNEQYNNSHNFVFSAVAGAHIGTVYYYGNYVHDLDTWDMAGCGPYHHSAIHSYSIETGSNTAIIDAFYIYNNIWEKPGLCPTSWVYLEGTASGDEWTAVGSGTAYIFNNIAIGTSIQACSGTGHIIVNNTVIDGNVASDTTSVVIKNNYISGASTFVSAESATTPVIDYNYYANSSGYNLWCWASSQCTGDFATYLTHTTNDDNSIDGSGGTGGINQSTGATAVDASTINNGVDLSSLSITELNSDKDGVARPQGAAWDIGAYEYPATYEVAVSATNVTMTPGVTQETGGTAVAFTVTGNYGYSPICSGCGGALVSSTYTTDTITENCTVTCTGREKRITGIGTGSGSLTIGGTGSMTLGN